MNQNVCWGTWTEGRKEFLGTQRESEGVLGKLDRRLEGALRKLRLREGVLRNLDRRP